MCCFCLLCMYIVYLIAVTVNLKYINDTFYEKMLLSCLLQRIISLCSSTLALQSASQSAYNLHIGSGARITLVTFHF